MVEFDEEPIDGRGIGDAGGHRALVRGGGGGCDADDRNARSVQHGAVRIQPGGLAGSGPTDDHIDAGARGGEVADHGLLVDVEAPVGGENLVDDSAWDACDTSVASAGRALQQFGLGGE